MHCSKAERSKNTLLKFTEIRSYLITAYHWWKLNPELWPKCLAILQLMNETELVYTVYTVILKCTQTSYTKGKQNISSDVHKDK